MTWVVKRTMKLINGHLDEIIAKKGCDASNMFDEEVMKTEQEYSDDEEEKEAKKLRKLQNRRKRDRPDGAASSSGEDLEDGEIKDKSS